MALAAAISRSCISANAPSDSCMLGAMQTELTRLLGVEAPIVQGSFGPWTSVALSAAVSEAGGLGWVGTAVLDADRVTRMIAAMRGARGPAVRRQPHVAPARRG